MRAGKLYLVPTILSEEALHVIPTYVHEITRNLDCFFVENERTARRYLRKSGYSRSFDEVQIHPLDEKTSPEIISQYISILKSGIDAGLMSEAGVPAVADPGNRLVAAAQRNQVPVVPLTGPSSIILALMGSGFNGQQFTFHGYLPVRQDDRMRKIRQLEQKAKTGETQIFIETPYRNQALLNDILKSCEPVTLLCVASDLTGPQESIQTKPVLEWKKEMPVMGKIPAIFLIGNFT